MEKDYRVRVTKMLIRKEFTELLKKKPIQEITVREICERTGIQSQYVLQSLSGRIRPFGTNRK